MDTGNSAGMDIKSSADIYEGLDLSSWKSGWEPGAPVFTGYEGEVEAIERKYPAERSSDMPLRTVFYGASNFRKWKNMDADLKEFGVQNHGFGGATDVLLVHYADRLLFPYAPDVAVIQSGSNDYAGLKGKPARQAAASLELKKRMYRYFLDKLPDTRFVLLSPLLMPGAPYFTETSLLVSEGMAEICRDLPRLSFTDAAGLTYNCGEYRTELFVSDGIHLNRSGQLALKDIVKEVLHGIFEDIRG
jgi:lysophospholipase L1-like esterase